MASAGKVGALLVEMRAELGGLRLDVKEMEKIFKTSFGNVEGMAKSFAKILGTSFGVHEIIAYGQRIVALGGQLKDLSQQTGISGQTLSGIKSTLEESGSSLDAFAKGIFTLQKNLGGIKNESDPAAQAVKALGLNLDTLRQADTETFLNLITDALGNVTNPLNRNALGAQLLGKSFRELGPAIQEIAGRLAELRAGGMTDEDIDTIDRFGDAWTKVSTKLEVFVAGNLAQTIEDVQHLIKLIELGSLKLRLLFADIPFLKFTGLGENPADLQRQIDELLSPQSHTPVTERAKFKPPVDTEAVKKLADAIKKVKQDTESFIDGLQKQNLALELSQLEIDHTAEEIKKLELEQEKAAFINKTLRDSLAKTIPPELLAKIDQWNAKILENTTAIAKEKRLLEEIQAVSKAWVKDIDDLTKAEEEWAAIKFDPISLGMDDLSRTLDEIGKKYVTLIVRAEAAAKAARATPEEIETVVRRLKIDQALEQVKARIGFTGEGVDSEEDAKKRAEDFGNELANSLTGGMRNTLLGIETGQQTLGEGMKNLVRNMLLELQGAIFDKTILEPLKIIAAGFISGLVGALDDAANTQLKDWAKGLGKQVSSWLGTGLSSILGAFGGGGGGVNASTATFSSWEGGFIGRERGGMLPSFAGGGLFIGHGGEFVMQKKAVDSIGADTLGAMNKSGRMPGGGATAVTVEINGDITPRQPNMTPDQVVRVTAGNITNDGMIMSAIEQRMRMKGR